eukprot:178859-Prymnesium_polylepis.1
MPGGLEAVGRVTAELKAAGVRVLWPYNPWDTGTRREPLDDAHTFAALLKQALPPRDLELSATSVQAGGARTHACGAAQAAHALSKSSPPLHTRWPHAPSLRGRESHASLYRRRRAATASMATR